jgi:hypothetical protein
VLVAPNALEVPVVAASALAVLVADAPAALEAVVELRLAGGVGAAVAVGAAWGGTPRVGIAAAGGGALATAAPTVGIVWSVVMGADADADGAAEIGDEKGATFPANTVGAAAAGSSEGRFRSSESSIAASDPERAGAAAATGTAAGTGATETGFAAGLLDGKSRLRSAPLTAVRAGRRCV